MRIIWQEKGITCINLQPALEQSWKINGIVTAVVVALSQTVVILIQYV